MNADINPRTTNMTEHAQISRVLNPALYDTLRYTIPKELHIIANSFDCIFWTMLFQ